MEFRIKKMKRLYARRSGVLLTLLSLLTLTISSLFVYAHVEKEVASFSQKKRVSYFLCWLLGLLSLGLVPLLWQCRRMDEIQKEAKRLSLAVKGSYERIFNWKFFASLILVGPFIANHLFFASLNQVQARRSVPSLEQEEAPAQEKMAEPEESDASAPSQPAPTTRVIFEAGARKAVAKTWRVRCKGGAMTFQSQEQAIAYAKALAEQEGVNVRVLAKQEAPRR